MKVPYLKKLDDSIIFDGEYLEVYIPKSSFDTGIAGLSGEYLETLGIFNFKYFPEGKEHSESAELRTMNLAFKIKIGYSSFYNIRTVLNENIGEESYMVYCLKRGDIFCLKTANEKSSANTKACVNLIHGGKLPKSVPYGKVLDDYVNSMTLNGVNLNSQLQIFELIIAELYRSQDDLTVPFRKIIGNDPTVSELAYEAINLKRLPAINSTFAGLSFEDINQSIISGLKKSKLGEEEKESPIEVVMKY